MSKFNQPRSRYIGLLAVITVVSVWLFFFLCAGVYWYKNVSLYVGKEMAVIYSMSAYGGGGSQWEKKIWSFFQAGLPRSRLRRSSEISLTGGGSAPCSMSWKLLTVVALVKNLSVLVVVQPWKADSCELCRESWSSFIRRSSGLGNK